jgi:hypothetical protein
MDAYAHVLQDWSDEDVLALTTMLERLREATVRASEPVLEAVGR